MKLTMTEIRSKDAAELTRLQREMLAELRQLRVKAGAEDLKDVRAIRNLRRHLAQVSTRLSELTKTA